MNFLRNIVQLADGTYSIVTTLPGQAARTWPMLPPGDRKFLLSKIGLNDFQEDSVTRALPFIAIGIVGIVAFNIYRGSR